MDIPSSWQHLWPDSDNHHEINQLLTTIMDDYYQWHASLQSLPVSPPSSPVMLQRAIELLTTLSTQLGEASIPWPAPNYLAHMNTDVFLPASLAYFTAMLYNPNNVTPEASPVTTQLEYELSDDFCALFGFDPRLGWAHLTSGGHAANYEAIWIARNLKSIPLAIRETPALRHLLTASEVDHPFNLAPRRIAQLLDQAESQQQLIELLDTAQQFHQDPTLRQGVLLVASGRHYAWDKCANLLGIGRHQLELVELDEHFRIDIDRLRERIFSHLHQQRPIIAVVATVGSSGEGSVDAIDQILGIRQACELQFQSSFFLHVDAAQGGYYRSMIRPSNADELPSQSVTSRQHIPAHAPDWLKPEIAAALQALEHADTITVDPHKNGHIPYPAGCLAIRDRRYSQVVISHSKYFGQSRGEHMDFGPYTLEGARPGAATAAVWIAHRLLSLDQQGYGLLLAQNLRVAQQLQHALEQTPPLLIQGEKYRFHSAYEPDLNMLNFYICPTDKHTDIVQVINQMSEDLLSNSGSRKPVSTGPWFSRNQLAADVVLQNPAYKDQKITVLRCCVMKSIPAEHFALFWQDCLRQIIHDLEPDATLSEIA
ncbi:pyridoxal phosphate-dependent decarboxylase family protein [Acinetobacter sp. WZC-1]|uniref:pyridoxal phosphate-dependent decarboxylase family protein n=1 Tax=Acinetobacter sp. WZC-1 TaxID=3459034 RepID=UPI00403DAB94